MAKTRIAPTTFMPDDPENFGSEELTTADVRRAADELEAEKARTRKGARKTGRGVQKVQRIQRGHQGSKAAAESSQTPKRENFPVEFKPTSDLEAPPAPKGMVLRWIRFKTPDGKPDNKNMTKKHRMGWRPFLAKDAVDYLPPETAKTTAGEAICSGDLMLCFMPAELKQRRDAYYRRQAMKRTSSIKDKVRATMGDDVTVTDQLSRTRGRRPTLQSDE